MSSCCDMSPDVWSKLPEDLIIAFLRLLPKEALLEFRCVSKAYNFMITTSLFPKLAASSPISAFVFQWEKSIFPELESKRSTYPRISYPPKYYFGYVSEFGGDFATQGGRLIQSYFSLLPFRSKTDDFLGCYNGIFLVRNGSSVPIQYYVCNPATKQWVPIPPNPAHLQKDSFAGLAFDPLHPLPHNFKIVRVACCPATSCSLSHQPQEMDIFSSATGKWVNYLIPLEPEILEFKCNRRSLYVNGVFYMLSKGKYLLCFDLDSTNDDSLKARSIKLPPGSRDDCVGLFESSNGCLYYASKVDHDLLVWIFQIGNEASPWTLKYNINVSLPHRSACLRARSLSKQTFIFAVDFSAEIIYVGKRYYAMSYEIKSKRFDYYAYVNYGSILYDTSLCFYPYSCCLLRLSEQFSVS